LTELARIERIPAWSFRRFYSLTARQFGAHNRVILTQERFAASRIDNIMSPQPASVKLARRRLQPPAPIAPELHSIVRNFADALLERHGDLFARDPRLKRRIAAELRRLLPPQPGRPGFASVTEAIRLHGEITRSHPERSHKEIWKEIYPRVIPGWQNLGVIESAVENSGPPETLAPQMAAKENRNRIVCLVALRLSSHNSY
jgi:hypothetical protein